MTTLAPAPVMEPGLSAVHATDRVETPVETPAVSDEERDASVRMPAEEDTHASDDKLGEKSGKKQSQRQRLSEACIESLSAMHGGKPEAVGFYKDDIIAAVKAKHGYTDKPEIYQIVLGDAKVFAREVGTRKQGVKQGRPRTLYSLVSLKGPPRPSSPSPTRQNIKDASPEAAVDVEAKKEPADEPAAPAPAPTVAAAAAAADAADQEGRTNRPRRAAANRVQQKKEQEEEEARIEEALKEEDRRRSGKKARGRPPKDKAHPVAKRPKVAHHPSKSPGLADAADILLDLASNENSPAASGEHEGMIPASPLGSPMRRRRTSATDSENEAHLQQRQNTMSQPMARRPQQVRWSDEELRPDVHAEMNLSTPKGQHFDFMAAAAAARHVAGATGTSDGQDYVAKDAAVAMIIANDAKGEKQLRKALDAQNRAITALLSDREARSATVSSLCGAVENIAQIAASRQQQAANETRRAAAAIAAPTFMGMDCIRDARRELDQMRSRMMLELEKISARLDQGLR